MSELKQRYQVGQRGQRLHAGDTVGRWTLLEEPRTERVGSKMKSSALCRCSCGKERAVMIQAILNGASRSCGCLNRERIRAAVSKHGGTGTRLYCIWQSMIDRCENPRSDNYKYYGNRGISICEEWRSAFGAFQEWAKANGYQASLTIDRIDVDKGYEPDNCRWVSVALQNDNTTRTYRATAFGETKTAKQWSTDQRCAVSLQTLRHRIKTGWQHEAAVTTPPIPPSERKTGGLQCLN